VPALGALVAEPLFLLTDTALVGHLGSAPLAGLGIASVILQTIVGLLVFLAYATTPTVARRLGAGDRPGAIRAGIDGLWLALALGAVVLVVGLVVADPLVRALADTGGAEADPAATAAVVDAARTYLGISLAGIPAMLLVIAATGLLRGLQDTRTPLVVAVSGFAANAALNAFLIYGLGFGIAGSAWGTVIAQWGMAAVFVVIAVRAARDTGTTLRPGLRGVARSAASGGWLLVRTASLRAAILATVAVGAGLGVTGLATLQIALTLFSTVAFVLDALAIAGQALVGHGLGARDPDRVRLVTRRLVLLGIVGGALLGVLTLAVSGLLGPVFSDSAAVRSALPLVLVLIAVGMPVAGYVFVLDGVLIGAGDARYLAVAGLVNLVVYLPLLWWVGGTLAGLWAAFALGYIGVRAVTLGVRAHRRGWVEQALAR
jgi:putative MATE family efflux protein